MLWIQKGDKSYLFSPESEEEFLEAIKLPRIWRDIISNQKWMAMIKPTTHRLIKNGYPPYCGTYKTYRKLHSKSAEAQDVLLSIHGDELFLREELERKGKIYLSLLKR